MNETPDNEVGGKLIRDLEEVEVQFPCSLNGEVFCRFIDTLTCTLEVPGGPVLFNFPAQYFAAPELAGVRNFTCVVERIDGEITYRIQPRKVEMSVSEREAIADRLEQSDPVLERWLAQNRIA